MSSELTAAREKLSILEALAVELELECNDAMAENRNPIIRGSMMARVDDWRALGEPAVTDNHESRDRARRWEPGTVVFDKFNKRAPKLRLDERTKVISAGEYWNYTNLSTGLTTANAFLLYRFYEVWRAPHEFKKGDYVADRFGRYGKVRFFQPKNAMTPEQLWLDRYDLPFNPRDFHHAADLLTWQQPNAEQEKPLHGSWWRLDFYDLLTVHVRTTELRDYVLKLEEDLWKIKDEKE